MHSKKGGIVFVKYNNSCAPSLNFANEAAGSCRPDSPPLALILQSLWATLSLQPFIFSSPYVQGFIFALLSRVSSPS